MADRFPLIANPSTSTIQEIPSGDTLDLTGNNIKGAGIITATTFSGNLTGSVTGNAGGLTGTPNVVVGTLGCGNVTSTGDVTGVNATFSGNLTVQGTTTTIDTAVTDVDSLAIDGLLTTLGSVGIGTTNPSRLLVVAGSDPIIRSEDTDAANTYAEFKQIQGSLFIDSRSDTSDGTIVFRGVGGGSATEKLRILADGTVATGTLNATPGTVAAGSIVQVSANAGFFTNGYDGKFGTSSNHPVYIQVNGSSKLTIATNGDLTSTGTISDSIGPLRRLGINSHNAATYTLVAGDAGKLVREATNGANITIPQNVFTAGDMISIFNVSGGDNTITQGTGITLYNTGDGATGNRTLAAKGVCTIVCTSTNEFIISGSGLS